MANYLQRRVASLDQPEFALDLVDAIDRHELFHFRTELGLTRLEIASDAELYLDYRDWYRDVSYTSQWLPEALANATQLREMRRGTRDLRQVLMDEARHMPPGYRDFEQYLFAPGYRQGLTDLASLVASPLGHTVRSGELFDRPAAKSYEPSVPRHLILSAAWGPIGDGTFVRLVVPSSVRTLPLRKIEAHARRLGADVRPGGRHGRGIVYKGTRIPLKATKDVDNYIIKGAPA